MGQVIGPEPESCTLHTQRAFSYPDQETATKPARVLLLERLLGAQFRLWLSLPLPLLGVCPA